ncbi:MAG: type II secretion system protein [bacterium]
MNKNRGFTLVELLVVIAIVSLLSSVVLAALKSARAKARDSLRKEQLREFAKAAEVYASDNNGNYPGVIGYFSNILVSGSYTNFMPGYISSIQNDPQYPSNMPYIYMNKAYTGDWACETVSAAINTPTKYAFYAKLENPSAQDLATMNTDAYDTCIAANSQANYRYGN